MITPTLTLAALLTLIFLVGPFVRAALTKARIERAWVTFCALVIAAGVLILLAVITAGAWLQDTMTSAVYAMLE